MSSPKTEPPADWVSYWDNDDFWRKQPIWRINTGICLRGCIPHVGLKPDDEVLNVGCGAGYLEQEIASRVRRVLSVDTSPRFAQLCKENNTRNNNLEVAVLGEDYTNLEQLGQQFSLIMSIGVAMYYKDASELDAFVGSAFRCLKPGGRVLIAELTMRKPALAKLWDCWLSLWQSIRLGYFRQFLATSKERYFGKSTYRSFLDQHGVYYFTRRELEEIATRRDLDLQWIHEPVSLIRGRPSVLFRKREKS